MEQLDRAAARALLPSREETAAKWSFGRALLLCGSERFSGAALLSAEAALRSGAGLVQLCSAPAVIAAARVRLPEALLGELSGSDAEGLSSPARQLLKDGLERASALLFGCGAGLSRRARELLALAQSPHAADAPRRGVLPSFRADPAAAGGRSCRRGAGLCPASFRIAGAEGRRHLAHRRQPSAAAERAQQRHGQGRLRRCAGRAVRRSGRPGDGAFLRRGAGLLAPRRGRRAGPAGAGAPCNAAP